MSTGFLRLFLALSACVVAPTLAGAQSTAHLLTPSGCAPSCDTRLLTVDADVPAILSSVILAGYDISSPYVTPDGRVVAWLEQGGNVRPATLRLHDLPTGTSTRIAAPGVSGMVGNPARAEVFLVDDSGPFVLAPAGMRRLAATACSARFLLSPSQDGRRLLMFCLGNGTPAMPDTVVVFDTAAGQIVASRAATWLRAAMNGDGAEAYAIEYVGGGQRLRRVDLASGAVLADAQIPVLPGRSTAGIVSAVHFDRRSQRVFVLGDAIHAFDATSLGLLGSRVLPQISGAFAYPGFASLDDVGARLYVTGEGGVAGFTYYSYLVFDTTALTPIVAVDALTQGRFVAAPRPLAPTGLGVTLQGANVSLQWTPASANATTRYLLEVGSAPGRTDIFAGLDVGLQTSFAASGVPPGTYYIRLRAGNYVGLSAPSSEVVVTVQ